MLVAAVALSHMSRADMAVVSGDQPPQRARRQVHWVEDTGDSVRGDSRRVRPSVLARCGTKNCPLAPGRTAALLQPPCGFGHLSVLPGPDP